MRNLLARIAGWCVERPAPVLAAAAMVTLIAAIGALMLEADAGVDQLVDTDSQTFAATERFDDAFGDDPVEVLVRGDLSKLVLTSDLTNKLLPLEACLSGNAPNGQVFIDEPTPQPCVELAKLKPAHVVFGPATFLNQIAIQVRKLFKQQSRGAQKQARAAGVKAAKRAARQGLPPAQIQQTAKAAATEVINDYTEQALELATRYGQSLSLPTLNNARFVESVVFDNRRPGQPKPEWSFLFPTADSALLTVRLRSDLSDAERREAIDLMRAAVADDAFRIRDADYVVGGIPVVVSDLTDSLPSKVLRLLAIAFAVMALVLLAMLRPPLRLLPLAIALGAAALTFGGLAALGGSLTLAALAVLPVLLGLTVDYAIQFQARFGEARGAGSSPAAAAVEAAARGGANIGIAVLATGAGFVVLLFWPSPVIRTFGLLLLAGIAIAFSLTLTAGLAALSLTPATSARGGGRFAAVGRRTEGVRAAFGRVGRRVRGLAKGAVAASMAHAARVLVVGAVLAAAGWAVGVRTDISADLRAQLPPDLQGLRDAEALEQATGASGEVDVAVEAPDVTDPAVVTWMRDYKSRVLAAAGFADEPTSCVDQSSQLCPSIALPDLFAGEQGTPSQERITALLDLLPAYLAQAVVELDPETGDLGHTAALSFGIKVMPFDEQERLVERMRAEINPPGTDHDPPPGVSATVVGLPALIADASAGLDRDRYLFGVYGVLAVGLALLCVYRSARRAVVPLIPIVLATGWSALAIWALGIELNPMSATLGALVIAIATEFSVLLAARYEDERRAGGAIGDALRSAYSRTGTAVAASGLTAIAGFAVLGLSDIPILRDFGLLTVLDLAIALASVLVALPAVLVWAESGFAPFGRLAARVRARRGRPRTATP